MSRITVTHRHGKSFDVRVRGYALISDEPVTLGGDDEGPTPTELMVAGVAACAADEAVRCLAARGEGFQPIEIGADFAWDADGERIKSIHLTISLPKDLGEDSSDAVMESVLSCPARKMLTDPPTIEYRLHGSVPAVAALAGVGVNGESWPAEPPPDVDSE
ncbi:MAG: OsmC family protein [Candidatus Dormibacterales bacterium]